MGWPTVFGSGFLLRPTSRGARTARSCVSQRWRIGGFTLIELLVVMAVIGLLLSLAVPRYYQSVARTKEAVLRENLNSVREAIDKYYADRGRYPDDLDDIVTKKYMRRLPIDPVTESTSTWVLTAPTDPAKGGLMDVRSGAPGKARDGTSYDSW